MTQNCGNLDVPEARVDVPIARFKTPSEVANFFLEKGKKEGVTITPMKLIKIIYIAYGWALGAENIRLFDEEIEAWKYGPVIPSVYHEFKHFGSAPIVNFLSQEYNPFEDLNAHAPKIPENNEDVLEVLELVWDLYKDKSATRLMSMTHQQGTPWYKIWNEDNKRMNEEIPPEQIKTHYQTLIKSLLQDAA